MSAGARVERTHTIVIEAPIERVFPLFTPLGETLWAPGWQPEFLHPADGVTARFMVFRTGQGIGETLWACADWQPDDHFVRYVRVTPASRFGFVEVKARARSDAATEVSVTYRYVALTEAGEAELAAFTEDAFRAMIDGWQAAASAWLAHNSGRDIPH